MEFIIWGFCLNFFSVFNPLFIFGCCCLTYLLTFAFCFVFTSSKVLYAVLLHKQLLKKSDVNVLAQFIVHHLQIFDYRRLVKHAARSNTSLYYIQSDVLVVDSMPSFKIMIHAEPTIYITKVVDKSSTNKLIYLSQTSKPLYL